MAKEVFFTELAPRARLQKLAAAVPVAPTQAPAKETKSAAPGTAPTAKSVIVYGASWCKKCKEAKAFYEAQGQLAAYYDIEEQPERESEMTVKLKSVGRGFTSLPVIDAGGVISVGFSPPSQTMKAEAPTSSTAAPASAEETAASAQANEATSFDHRVGVVSGLAGLVLGWFAAGIFVRGKRHEGK